MIYVDKKELALAEKDRDGHLSIRDRAGDPFAGGMVIRMNSTYLELVDAGYHGRGIATPFGLLPVSILLAIAWKLWYPLLLAIYSEPGWDIRNNWDHIFASSAATGIFSLLLFGVIKLMRHVGEWFGYTHYPIRLNRKTRKVYVFNGEDETLTVSWDELYFVLQGGARDLGRYVIRANILKNSDTVATSFVFGYTVVGKEDPLRHWEFIRRYMEEGPQSVMQADGLQICHPIADKRETLHQGWLQLFYFFGGGFLSYLMLPFTVVFFLGRLVNRVTSKIPHWPADVEAACRIDPNDQYVRDERQNPAWYR